MINFARTCDAYQYSEIHKIQALWRAIIEEAINDLLNPLRSYEAFKAKEEVLEFIKSDYFNFVCEMAGLDEDYVRRIFTNLIKTLRTKKYRQFIEQKNRTTPKEKQKWRKYSSLKKY